MVGIMTDLPSSHTNSDLVHHAESAQGDNCVTCRIIGSVLPIAISGYILYAARLQWSQYVGFQRVAYVGLCTGLSAGLIYLGGYRLFQKRSKDTRK
ncbi:hypothetical protein EG68_07894 [Paragonimus skrjabini miyazakii]|uniref:DUF4536 domain-containing protein n=1 Tax=Paragonimus skrjabini miyazakii TaxID=59628 RepID=A0A8S9YNG1_9TREM|nr:hypothetical protein EG68_07894 [Paragonimus skrjabini miyazakii]